MFRHLRKGVAVRATARLVGVLLATLCAGGIAWAQAPHQHGHGTVHVAIEGNRLTIELHAPGADIVGFERPPNSAAEEVALAAAIAALKQPLGLFGLPAAARCTVAEAEVTLEGYDKPAAAPAATHTEFEAAYVLTCADVGAIRIIEFPLFRIFAGAEELDVTVLTDRGPTEYEVTRDKPRLDRGNLLMRWLTGR